MRVKITMEMCGNEFLDLIRRVPKDIANQLFVGAVTVQYGMDESGEEPSSSDSLYSSAKQLIEAKKR